jgi:hypothetical protein
MADNQQSPSGETARPNGAAHEEQQPAKLSIREIAEAAYDEITAPEEAGAVEQQPPVESDPTQPRDERGRFVAKDATQPGEQPPAEEQATQPREEGQRQQEPTQPAPKVDGAASSEAPANWPAADRELFAKQTPEAQQFLLRRHSEMESDYQRRVQATRGAADFVGALDPVFRDPVISGSLQQNNMSAAEAIIQWAGFHRRAMSPNVADKVGLLFELAARMQIDPAVFTTGRPGPQGPTPQLSEADLKDPAIKYFADHVGRTSNEVQALRSELQGIRQAEQEKAQAEAVRVHKWGIDSFADEKGADGKPLRPDFDQLIPTIIELFRANPDRDLKEAYETARWINPTTRQSLIAAERAAVEKAESNRRAAAAVKGNVRGLTSPVTKPKDDGKPKNLRSVIEQSADEIGF